jgi:YHS domain-containing protein
MNQAQFSYRQSLAGAVLALAIVSAGAVGSARAQQTEDQPIGLEGNCPVCIVEANKWEKGSPYYKAIYDRVTYYFPNDSLRQKFVASPAKYVPALGGDSVISYENLGKRVPGSIQYGTRYADRVFLFPIEKELRVFLKNKKKFANVDLALNGDCAVCLANLNKHVPGKAEFMEIHNGFRYLFPSAKEQAAFRKDPARFASADSKSDDKAVLNKDRPTGK